MDCICSRDEHTYNVMVCEKISPIHSILPVVPINFVENQRTRQRHTATHFDVRAAPKGARFHGNVPTKTLSAFYIRHSPSWCMYIHYDDDGTIIALCSETQRRLAISQVSTHIDEIPAQLIDGAERGVVNLPRYSTADSQCTGKSRM